MAGAAQAAPWAAAGNGWEHPAGWVLRTVEAAETNPTEDGQIVSTVRGAYTIALIVADTGESASATVKQLTSHLGKQGFGFQPAEDANMLQRFNGSNTSGGRAIVGQFRGNQNHLVFAVLVFDSRLDPATVLATFGSK
jgi:hypothetical protein